MSANTGRYNAHIREREGGKRHTERERETHTHTHTQTQRERQSERESWYQCT